MDYRCYVVVYIMVASISAICTLSLHVALPIWNIEQLQGTTVGIMLLALNGQAADIKAALQYLNQLQVEVQRINLAEVGAK